jgi:hypothetical protein
MNQALRGEVAQSVEQSPFFRRRGCWAQVLSREESCRKVFQGVRHDFAEGNILGCEPYRHVDRKVGTLSC